MSDMFLKIEHRHDAKEELREVIKGLFATHDLNPSFSVNAMFNRLVGMALYLSALPTEIGEDELKMLWHICAQGESRLEKYWANLIIEGKATIKDFPYYINYTKLTSFEIDVLSPLVSKNKSKLLFIGHGSVPLTPMLYANGMGVTDIVALDIDAEAISLAKDIVNLTGFGNCPIEFKHSSGVLTESILHPYATGYDIIVLAALAGESSQEKMEIVSAMTKFLPDGTIVALRSVPNDGRRLLYPVINVDNLVEAGLSLIGEYSMPRDTGVINSIVVGIVRRSLETHHGKLGKV